MINAIMMVAMTVVTTMTLTNKKIELDNIIENSFKSKECNCKLCGRKSPYIAIGECSLCWDMEKGLQSLIEKDRGRAIRWLEDNLKELKG